MEEFFKKHLTPEEYQILQDGSLDYSKLDQVSKKALEAIRNHRDELFKLNKTELGKLLELHLYLSSARTVLFD